jgi:hypothetical protein
VARAAGATLRAFAPEIRLLTTRANNLGRFWTAALLLGAFALPAVGAPALKPTPRPAQRPSLPARAVNPLSRANFRSPSAKEMAQFYAELRRQPGWFEVQIATVPTGYLLTGHTIVEVGTQFATYFGDVDGDRQSEWVVGCYVGIEDAANAMAQDGRARVAVFDQDAEGIWRATWRSPGLGFEFAEPVYNAEEVATGLDELEHLLLPLSLTDIDGDRRLEIAFHCRSALESVGGLPGVYRLDGRRWVSVAPQADRFSLRDVDGDKKLEAVTGTRRIGHGTGDDDVPRVWRWKDRQFREASGEFPRFYADLSLRYSDFLKRKLARGENVNRAAWERAIQKAASLSGRAAAGRRGERQRGAGPASAASAAGRPIRRASSSGVA